MAEQTRKPRPTVGGWLRPLAVGTMVGTYSAVAVQAFVLNGGWFGPWVALGIGVLLGTAWWMLYIVLLGAVDISLLAMRIRTLPVGRSAWLSATGSAFAINVAYSAIKPISYYKGGVWVVLLAFFIPMVAGALIVRLVWGRKP